jgi:DNA-binding GntR family transcriptional regulator
MSNATEATYRTLRDAILDGDYALGSRLGEVELATSLGVSRTPVREALRRLSADGLVEVLPNRGARVVLWTEEDLNEIYELRALLESYGAARAAERITAADLNELSELCDEMSRVSSPGASQDLDKLSELNAQFHALILRAADSRRLHAMIGAVVQVPLVLRTFHRYSEPALGRSQGHHRELVSALTARDSQWARSVMSSHVLAARHVLTADATVHAAEF